MHLRPLSVLFSALAVAACAGPPQPAPSATAAVAVAQQLDSAPAPAEADASPAAAAITVSRARAFRAPLAAAIEAYRNGDNPAMLARAREAAALAPQHPRPQLVLAVALARSQHSAEAVATLERVAERGMHADLNLDPALAALAASVADGHGNAKPGGTGDASGDREAVAAAIARLQTKLAALAAPIGASELAFTLPDTDLLAESVAYDASSGAFLISSVHQRKIVRRDRDGSITDFTRPPGASTDDDIWGILGLAIHGDRVWACTAAVPEMRGYVADAHEGKSALLGLSLATGEVVTRVEAPDDGQPHSFGDLLVDSRGAVYVADSRSGAIYLLPAGGDTLDTLVEPGQLRSPQGLVLVDDDSTLLVADYGFGIARVTLDRQPAAPADAAPDPGTTAPPGQPRDHTVATSITYLPITAPPQISDDRSGSTSAPATEGDAERAAHPQPFLVGIDGLVAYRGDLLAIQNGLTPHRILRLTLSRDHTAITRVTPVVMNHPRFDEPTVGVVVANNPEHDLPAGFYYVANSQWGAFGPRAPEGATRAPPAILRYRP
ncbi:MAG: hypothetical protein Tsb0020_19750 [Haliangiales bacterium]